MVALLLVCKRVVAELALYAKLAVMGCRRLIAGVAGVDAPCASEIVQLDSNLCVVQIFVIELIQIAGRDIDLYGHLHANARCPPPICIIIIIVVRWVYILIFGVTVRDAIAFAFQIVI